MVEVLSKSLRYGEICPNCPSPELGVLAVHEACEGPKQVALGTQSVDYCGRQHPEKTYAQKIYDEVKKHYIDD